MCSANMGKAGCRSHSSPPPPHPCVLCPGPHSPHWLLGPSGSAAVRAVAARGQPDRLTLPGATAELEAWQSELGQQMGLPTAVVGVWGAVTICGPAWVVPWVAKARLDSQHPLGVGPCLAAQGLACCCRNRGGQPLVGGALEVRLGVCGGGGEGCHPWGESLPWSGSSGWHYEQGTW